MSLFLVGAARAEVPPDTTAAAALRVYADDDRVTVVTPEAEVQAPLGRRVGLAVTALVDVVTAASIDVTSQASRGVVHDQRVEVGAATTVDVARAVSLAFDAVGSVENDYESLHLGAGVHVEPGLRNTVLDAHFTTAIDQVGRRGDPWFARPRDAQRLVVTLTEVLDPRTLVDVVGDGEWVHGYQASPYRFVPIETPTGGKRYSLDEETPVDRWRGALLVRLRRAFLRRWFVHADYRFYGDSWDVTAHTASALVLATFGRATVGAEARAGWQGAASFYRARYVDDGSGVPVWRTRDRALGGVVSASGGLDGDVRLGADPLGRGPRLLASVAVMRFRWLDYPLQATRTAVDATLGLSWTF